MGYGDFCQSNPLLSEPESNFVCGSASIDPSNPQPLVDSDPGVYESTVKAGLQYLHCGSSVPPILLNQIHTIELGQSTTTQLQADGIDDEEQVPFLFDSCILRAVATLGTPGITNTVVDWEVLSGNPTCVTSNFEYAPLLIGGVINLRVRDLSGNNSFSGYSVGDQICFTGTANHDGCYTIIAKANDNEITVSGTVDNVGEATVSQACDANAGMISNTGSILIPAGITKLDITDQMPETATRDDCIREAVVQPGQGASELVIHAAYAVIL